jgi:hypothetical protein
LVVGEKTRFRGGNQILVNKYIFGEPSDLLFYPHLAMKIVSDNFTNYDATFIQRNIFSSYYSEKIARQKVKEQIKRPFGRSEVRSLPVAQSE